MELKNIVPGTGLGDLKFGMKKKHVKSLIGDPDEAEEGLDGSNLDYFHYDEYGLSICFDGTEDYRLSTIVCDAEDIELYGKKVNGFSKEQITALLKSKGFREVKTDFHSSGDTETETVECEEIEMMFWFENDELFEVEWGPFFMDENEIKWPTLTL
jgi:hypothetical protein